MKTTNQIVNRQVEIIPLALINSILHDTPVKGLFNMNKRYFDGCMRVEKAIELAHLILKIILLRLIHLRKKVAS